MLPSFLGDVFSSLDVVIVPFFGNVGRGGGAEFFTGVRPVLVSSVDGFSFFQGGKVFVIPVGRLPPVFVYVTFVGWWWNGGFVLRQGDFWDAVFDGAVDGGFDVGFFERVDVFGKIEDAFREFTGWVDREVSVGREGGC